MITNNKSFSIRTRSYFGESTCDDDTVNLYIKKNGGVSDRCGVNDVINNHMIGRSHANILEGGETIFSSLQSPTFPSKEQLSQLRFLKRELSMLEERIVAITSCVERATSVLSAMPRGDGASRTIDLRDELIDLKSLLLHRKIFCCAEEVRLELFISTIDDSFLRLVFSMRYIDGLTWIQIAHRIGNNTADSIRMAHDRFLQSQCACGKN